MTPKGATRGADNSLRSGGEKRERGERGARQPAKKKQKKQEQRRNSEKGGKRGREKVNRDKFIPECSFWENGACKKGDECPFAHIGTPQKKNELCSFFARGTCVKGDACVYAHTLRPCAFHHLRPPCKNSPCVYSHDPMSAAETRAFREDHEQRRKERNNLENTESAGGEVVAGDVFNPFNPFAAGS
jgi:hypothetical protein